MTLDDFERYFNEDVPEFEETNFITLAGFMSSYQKDIEAGTVITIDQFQFTVLEYDHAHIDYFSLVILPTNP